MKRFLPFLLASALLACIILFVIQWRRADAAEHTLQETYLSALGESTEILQDLSLNLEKLLISHDDVRSAALLGEISRQAGDIRHALAFLPISQADLAPLMTFADQLARKSADVLSLLVQKTSLTENDRTEFSDALRLCNLLSGQLSTVRDDVLQGNLLISQAASGSGLPQQTPASLPDAKGLPRTEITLGQAMTIAGDFVGMDRVHEVSASAHVTGGSIPAWGISVHTEDQLLQLEVTRIGGKVLLMSPETAGFDPLRSTEDCIRAAEDFLADRDFPLMEVVWLQGYDGLCVITFAPVQQNVLIYPDLLTVQVRMDTAEVVGFEARQYWMNHTPRRLPSPALDEQEARSCLSPDIAEQSVRLCLIPGKDGEVLCWEFTVTRNDETYLIFIDAATGREAALQKIVMLEMGSMAA